MMDSMAATIKKNIPEVTEVYYSGENGEPVVFPNPEDMAAQGLRELPVDSPYAGSAFYVAHAGGQGDMEDDDSDDLAYWNGFDFGPNLTYAEEHQLQGDPGDYLNAAEAAKLTFDLAKIEGQISDYSDDSEYAMTLTDLAEIDGQESYVYRCEGGGMGATFAYAYQVGRVYVQVQGGQWVRLDEGSPKGNRDGREPAKVNWPGKYNSIDFVLEVANYDGKSFSFMIDDVGESMSAAAELDPNDPYSAKFGDMVFVFDGADTVTVTGGQYAQIYYRSQN
jgi:hypothetical protein